MSEFFKSAFDYFGNSGKSKGNNELVGNSIAIGHQTFKVINTIAEGGFSIVYEAQDVKTHKMYALKRLISHDNATNLEIMQEINYLKQLSGHSNIIKLLTAASIGQQKQGRIGTDFLIVTELCTGGQVIQLMQRRNKPFQSDVTLQIFNHVCKAIEHMHSQNPPLIHRDLKVENLLISNRAVVKLCDFGSATSEPQFPDNSWSGTKRSEVQEEIEKHTTPMYRTPEMLDLYQNFPITEACDIWALGCVLYYFCCNKHPFEDSAKLAILNANYTIPANAETNDRISGLIYQMLLIDPRQRSTIFEIINEIRVQASSANVILGPSIVFDKDSLIHLPQLKLLSDADDISHNNVVHQSTLPQPPTSRPIPNTPVRPVNKTPSRINPVEPTRPDVPPTIPTKSHITNPISNGNDKKTKLGLLKEGAGNIVKNIRDVSNKVIDQMSSSINKGGLDLTYVTSRIIMLPTPAESGLDLLTKDKFDDVYTFLNLRHQNQYYIYNLSLKFNQSETSIDRILHVGFDPLKSLSLNSLVMLCLHQIQWLLSNPKNVIVIQCADGRVASGINVVSLLCFCRLVDTSSVAADIVRSRRGDCAFTPSQLRYADYICRLMRNIDDPSIGPEFPHNFVVKITGIELEPVPFFNVAKTGLRPFVEIYKGYKLVFSSMTSYEDLCLFTHDHKSAHISIPNINVCGDVNIVIYHTRSDIITKGKVSAIRVCETQIYTGYLASTCSEICLDKYQLDNCDSELEKYPVGFNLKIQLHVTNKEALSVNNQALSWNSVSFTDTALERIPNDNRMVLFNSRDEMQSCIISSGVKLPMKEPKAKLTPSEPIKTKSPESKEDFFFTLDWTTEEPNDVKTDIPHCSPTFSGSPIDELSTNNELNDELSSENENIEAVGDLLGDFEITGNTAPYNTSPNHIINTDIDGLVDFFSAFSGTDDQPVQSSSNTDLFAAFASNSNLHEDRNLLFFESSDNDNNNTDFMFDPFGQGIKNTNNSSSIADLTSQQSRISDWEINSLQDSVSNQPSPTFMKSSNSTHCLSNMSNPSQLKTSPSFNGCAQLPQKSEIFENANGRPIAPPKPVLTTKPIPPPKPKLAEKVENLPPPRNKRDTFQDLLGDFKPSDSWNGCGNSNIKSIKDIRKETQSRTTDPDALKVLDWIEGREKNIRALLCSLPSILWSEVRWPGVSMAELVTVGQVKKAYKNAVRCVHPDKWNSSEHEHFAKLIMMELNEAMTAFESEKEACR